MWRERKRKGERRRKGKRKTGCRGGKGRKERLTGVREQKQSRAEQKIKIPPVCEWKRCDGAC